MTGGNQEEQGGVLMKIEYNCHGGGRSVTVVVAVVIVMVREGKRRQGQEDRNTVGEANMVYRAFVAIEKEVDVMEEAERVTVVVKVVFRDERGTEKVMNSERNGKKIRRAR